MDTCQSRRPSFSNCCWSEAYGERTALLGTQAQDGRFAAPRNFSAAFVVAQKQVPHCDGPVVTVPEWAERFFVIFNYRAVQQLCLAVSTCAGKACIFLENAYFVQ